jgi:endoglucanase
MDVFHAGTYNVHYISPTLDEVDYFISKGANIIRLPFRWERLQPALFQAFNFAYLSRIKVFVDYVTATGCIVLLDTHNYARYLGHVIGGSGLHLESLGSL